jgi:predicted glutamine amidotransferase
MALELNVNSYAIAASADDYFATRLGSDAWDNASSTDKDSALVSASLELDNNNFIGQAVSTDQALAWPRNHAT